MIIYGDLMVEEGEDGKPVENRKLRFRTDGNILCGTRFRNFPAVIDNDVPTFLEAFKQAVLGLYGNDEKAVAQAKEEQKAEAEKKAESAIKKEKEALGAEDVKVEIAGLLKDMAKSDKVKVAKFFKENLGDADYRKSEDAERLLEALEFVKSV